MALDACAIRNVSTGSIVGTSRGAWPDCPLLIDRCDFLRVYFVWTLLLLQQLLVCVSIISYYMDLTP